MNPYQKYFVSATWKNRQDSASVSKITGEEIRQFYNEVISSAPPEVAVRSAPSTRLDVKKCTSQVSKVTSRIPKAETMKGKRSVHDFLKAAQYNDVQRLKWYVDDETWDVNVCDAYGWTALMCAAKNGSADAVGVLMTHNADLRILDNAGNSAWHYAKLDNHTEVMNVMKDRSSKQKQTKTLCVATSSAPKPAFYCNLCKMQFTEVQHRTSTVHLLGQKPRNVTNYQIPEHNAGFQLMLRQGWDRDKGLGPNGSGIKCPLKTVLKRDRKGLGNKLLQAKARITHFKPNDRNAVKHVNAVPTSKHSAKQDRRRRELRDRRKEIAFRRMFHD